MELSTEMILAIVSVILAIVSIILGIAYDIKNRKKTELIFLKIRSISLKDITQNIDDIEITIQGNKVSENLILLKGAFINSGNLDIENSVVHKPLEIAFPENYQLIDFKISKISNGLDIKIDSNFNKVIFHWDLFKEGEYFAFNSLVEYKDSLEETKNSYNRQSDLIMLMDINHRITNMKKVQKEHSVPKADSTRFFLFFIAVLILFITSCFYFSFGQYFFPSYKVYSEVQLGKKKEYVEFIAKTPNQILLTNDRNKELNVFQQEILPKFITSKVYIKKKEIDYWLLGGFGFGTIVYIVLLILMIRSVFKEKSLYNKCKDISREFNRFDTFDEQLEEGPFFRLLTPTFAPSKLKI